MATKPGKGKASVMLEVLSIAVDVILYAAVAFGLWAVIYR